MSTTKRIVVFSNANGKRLVIENAEYTTWGPLKQHLQDEGFDMNSLEAVERGTKTSLVHADAQLPSGDFTIILVEKQMKSGGMPPKQDKFTELGLKQLRKLCKKVKITTTGDRSSLLKRLRAKDKRSVIDVEGLLAKKTSSATEKTEAKPTATTSTSCTKSEEGKLTPEEAKNQVSSIIEEAKSKILCTLDSIEVSVGESIDLFAGLEEEAEEIAKGLK